MSMKIKSICEMRSTSIIKCVWVIHQYPILDPKWVEKKLSFHTPTLALNEMHFLSTVQTDWFLWLMKEVYYMYNNLSISLLSNKKSRDVSINVIIIAHWLYLWTSAWYWKVTFSTRVRQLSFTSLNPCLSTMFQGWCGCVGGVPVPDQWCEESFWRLLQGVQRSIPEVGTLHRCCPCPTSWIGKKP